MAQLEQLRYFSLVSKVTTGLSSLRLLKVLSEALSRPEAEKGHFAELEVHLGLSEKTLSEFIIDLSKGTKHLKEFQAKLAKNGAELPAQLVETIWSIIQRLMPAQSKQAKPINGAGEKFSGLAIPDAK